MAAKPAKKRKFKFTVDKHENMIYHVFLPRELPVEESDNFLQHEIALLKLMVDVIEEFADKYGLPDSTVQLIRSLHKIQCEEKLDAEVICKEIRNMLPGKMLGMCIRQQNCGLIFYMPKSESKSVDGKEVIVSTFQVSLNNEQIYDTNENIHVNYPSRSIKTRFSRILKSKEFAEQLCSLHWKNMEKAMPRTIKAGSNCVETRNVPTTSYVSEWLLSTISNRYTAIASDNDLPVISKKVRDEILWQNTKLPFRRSGFWMFIKVLLQINLTVELGDIQGQFLYKLIINKYLSEMCNFFNNEIEYPTFGIDVAIQMLAKVARRIEKFAMHADEPFKSLSPEIGKKLRRVFESERNIITDIIRAVRARIDIQFDHLQNEDKINGQLSPLLHVDFIQDAKQQTPKLKMFLKKRNIECMSMNDEYTPIPKSIYRHRIDTDGLPNAEIFSKLISEYELSFYLADVENWIFNIKHWDHDEGDIRNLAITYASKAESLYTSDPMGRSKMALTLLKIIYLLDVNACKKYPLLLSHRSGINSKIIDNLLLPQRIDMELALKLQKYFQNRNECATHPGLLEEEKISENSFSVRFAKINAEMKDVKSTILAMTESDISDKKMEWMKARERVGFLKIEAYSMKCSYFINKHGQTIHCRRCDLCSLKSTINRCQVDLYERLLPPDDHHQNAVVFELIIPLEIACLRDVLYIFVKGHYKSDLEAISIFGNWIDYGQIAQFAQWNQTQVFLGSSRKRIKSTHYGREGRHPDCDFGELIVNNGFDCTFYGSQKSQLPTQTRNQTVKHHCTFQVEKTSEYRHLQKWLEGTTHWQNTVLAEQHVCPPDLKLSEYVNFGSLRCDGHRLQLRNLYRIVETDALSFENQSVLSLILQTLWEAGPNNSNNNDNNNSQHFCRESHADFADEIFANEMIKLMDKFIHQQRSNWKQPLKLLMCSLIAVRIFEINIKPSIAHKIVKLLKTFRVVATEWMTHIISAKKNSTSKEDCDKLQANLIEAAVSGAITYYIHPQHALFETFFQGNIEYSLVYDWLHFNATINNNILLNGHDAFRLHEKMLLRIIRRIGINLESQFIRIVKRNQKPILDFIQAHWLESVGGTFDSLMRWQDSPQIVFTYVDINDASHYVQIDLMSGEFLVNDLPVSRLPDTIAQTALFKRVFGSNIFEVQPTNQSFSTIYKYNNCIYVFRPQSDSVIITEIQKSGDERELIPPEVFKNEIPFLLVQNFSHWWNKNKNIIEFRPKEFTQNCFSLPEGIQYELDVKTSKLTHVKTRRHMLDVCSQTFENIANHLSRLESSKFIHVFIEDRHMAKVELIRMDLKFNINTSTHVIGRGYDILSNEYNEMRVSLNQKFGTLMGLCNGLLLESIYNDANATSSKIFILPHGNVETNRTEVGVTVKISLNEMELRRPPFFIYQIDKVCRYLKANNSFPAWFYLAHLHAVTSHPIPDPFTGTTGTERCLQILQSGFSWSSEPYDNESFRTLKDISNLSPVRQFYPDYLKVMQTVRWPVNVTSYAASDSYIFIVEKILSDSKRLEALYSDEEKNELKSETHHVLNKRAYYRNLPFYPNYEVSSKFILPDLKFCNNTFMNENENMNENVVSARILSTLFDENCFNIPNGASGRPIYELLTSVHQIDGFRGKELLNVADCVSNTLPNLWITLYEVARKELFTKEKIFFILNLLAHEGNDFDNLLILQSIAINPEDFKSIEPPPFVKFNNPKNHDFDRNQIIGILDGNEQTYTEYEVMSATDKENYDREYFLELETLADCIKDMWPCDDVDKKQIMKQKSDKFNMDDAIPLIDTNLKLWNENRKFTIFIDAVENKIQSLIERSTQLFSPEAWPRIEIKRTIKRKSFKIDFDEKMCRKFKMYAHEINQAKAIFIDSVEEVQTLNHWWNLFKEISMPKSEMHLVMAEMYPRLVPIVLFPKIMSKTINELQKYLIGALAVLTTRDQRIQRIGKAKSQDAAMINYEENGDVDSCKPHQNWKPVEYPEWLLFEIEMDLTIRRIQIEVTKRMIKPPETTTKHSVMQLNMGEGKTSVIVPILAAYLADGEQLCQVTVLKPLFATNLKSLRQCLGGMLNRRVYTFPCRRDMPINDLVKQIIEIHEECKKEMGIVITLPEYRLSLQLKMYEAALNNNSRTDLDQMFFKAHKWLNDNVRHVLDESDAILHAKYQLIYTVGKQKAPDGGSMRWTVIQALLKRVPHQIYKLSKQYGDEKLEFDPHYIENSSIYGSTKVKSRSDVFTPCRILDDSVYEHLKIALIADFQQGKLNINFNRDTLARDSINTLLMVKSLDLHEFNRLINKLDEHDRETILILAGFLKFEVLRLVLTKRWRVSYGVNEAGKRKMAVPFKAKDVAAERTEFGHPDVAICFTQLSYYYSGLTDFQLYQVFESLDLTQNPEEIYEDWISYIPECLVDKSIQFFKSINLKDTKQRDDLLFPLLRYNMHVIDYWLSNTVFPREAKTFDSKMMCTAWDLCTDHMQHIVTGFSGTNDTKDLLPMPISQNDLDELEQTNEQVRQILLQNENNRYKKLQPNISGLGILKELVQENIPVLLDSGALMLELNNEQVAREWLKLVRDKSSYDAAIYFSASDILLTIDGKGNITEFEYSVYREKLNRCLIYLDDAHTRGTDLKFPNGTRACVTLCGGITRDKTVQACMRMRMLGKGHSVCFWASHEADINIRKICQKTPNDSIETENVIEFICNNSKAFIKEDMVHWAAAGLNYAQKISAHKRCQTSQLTKSTIKILAQNCTDNEYLPLMEMYGAKEDAFLVDLTKNRFGALAKVYDDHPDVCSFIEKITDGIVNKLQQHIPEVKRCTQLFDEEQEKELEHELEEQRQVFRPKESRARGPSVDPLLQEFFKFGFRHGSFKTLKNTKTLVPLPLGLQNTHLFKTFQKNLSAWQSNVYVTRDFMSVIKLNSTDKNDYFLRPVWWIGRVLGDPDVLVLLSPFECNLLLQVFRTSSCSVLHMYSCRLSRSHSNLLHNKSLQIPPNSDAKKIRLTDEAQIAMFSGSMYFETDQEESAYCNLMGIIPMPAGELPVELQKAFDDGFVSSNGFVSSKDRDKFPNLKLECKFNENPAKLAIAVIERRHEYLRKRSHVASILIKGKTARSN